MRVAVYARVSSERQAEKDLSIPSQLKALRKYALDREWDVAEEYVDEAKSATSANRPAFKDMIAAAKGKVKPFDAILVWKLSRFARNREDSVLYKSLLRRQGISVISMNEQVDESPAGYLLEGIIEVIDEFYSVNLSQDTLRGMRENATRGFRNGGSVPFGYKVALVEVEGVTKSKLTPDQIEAPIVQRAFELAYQGKGAKEVAKSLNADGLRTRGGKRFGATGINHIMRNEAYVGILIWNKHDKRSGIRHRRSDSEVIRVTDCHPALVDQQVFDQVQEMLTARRPSVKNPRAVSSKYLLSGLTRCGLCGSTAIGTTGKSGKFLYYSCNNRNKKGHEACAAPSMNARKLESFVVDRIKENILTDENLGQLVDLTNEELGKSRTRSEKQLEDLERAIKEVDRKLRRLYSALESGKVEVDDLAPRLKELRDRQREMKEKQNQVLDEMNRTGHLHLDIVSTQEYVGELRGLLESTSFLECKTFLGSFIRKVEFTKKQVGIEYTLPVRLGNGLTAKTEVLNTDRTGSAGRIRTYDQSINSRPLTMSLRQGSPFRRWSEH